MYMIFVPMSMIFMPFPLDCLCIVIIDVALRLDDLHESMRDMAADAQSPLVLYKADIDAAYRRVCIEPDQMQFAAVVFRYKGEVWISVHYANPFGGVACVHNWDRIGKYIRARLHPFSGLASKSLQAAC